MIFIHNAIVERSLRCFVVGLHQYVSGAFSLLAGDHLKSDVVNLRNAIINPKARL
jgi:hypothetical protein